MDIWLFIMNSNSIKRLGALSKRIFKIHSRFLSFIIGDLILIFSFLPPKTKIMCLFLIELHFLILSLQLNFLCTSISSRSSPSICESFNSKVDRVSPSMLRRHSSSTDNMHWQKPYCAFASFHQTVNIRRHWL